MKAKKSVNFIQYYVISLIIVILIMASSFFIFPVKSATLMQDLWGFFKEKQLYPNVISIGRFSVKEPVGFLILLFAAAPSLSAIILKWIIEGKNGLKNLFSRFKPIGNLFDATDAKKIYIWIFSIYAIVSIAYILAGIALVGMEGMKSTFDVLGGNFLLIIITLIIGIFIDEGGLLEELGWRGFGLIYLVNKYKNPFVATILLGFFWWLWHIPRDIVGVLSTGFTLQFVSQQALFLILCMALSIVISYAVFKTGGSVIPAILIHGGTNVWSKALSSPLYQTIGIDIRTIFVILVAITILIMTKGKLGLEK